MSRSRSSSSSSLKSSVPQSGRARVAVSGDAALRRRPRAAVESLEDRRLFAVDLFAPVIADIGAPDINGTPDSFAVTVRYVDDAGLNIDTIDEDDVAVAGPGGNLRVLGVETSGNPTDLTATYTIAAPDDGGFTAANDGRYTLQVRADQVYDLAGRSAPSDSRNFDVSVDTQDPNASVSVSDVNAAGGASHTVRVTYTDNAGIDAATIGTNDLTVTGPNGPLEVTGVEITGSGGEVVATYSIAAPGGSWDSADNGDYEATVNAGAVTDNAGNGVDSEEEDFSVSISGPTAAVSAVDINNTIGPDAYRITVLYSDSAGVNTDSIGADDLTITGPGGVVLSVSDVSFSTADDGKKVSARYTVVPPGGTWDQADNGEYAVTVNAGAVTDSAGNPGGGDTASFTVAVPPPDGVAPASTIANADLGTRKANHQVKITYTDDRGIDEGSFNGDDIAVSGPGGPVEVTGVTFDRQDGGRKYVVTYTLAGPGGEWENLDNGEYTIVLAGGAVTDTAGNAIAGESKGFTVDIAAPDVQGPTATIGVGDVSEPNGATHNVTVTYSDDRAVRASSIGIDDIRVTGPGGTLTVLGVTLDPDANNGTITATYTLAAPGGARDPTDNGTYTVEVLNDEVTDTNGNGVAAASKAFAVAAGVADGAAPAAAVSANDVTAGGGTNHTVVVTYTDDAAINEDTIGADDVTVTGPGGALAVSTVVINSSDNGRSVVATYTVAAPAGGWTYAHNGTYTVTVNADAVRDLSNKGVAPTSGTFRVAAPAPQPIDTTWGGGSGNVNAGLVGEALATQGDGMIVVAGREGDVGAGNAKAVLQRFNATGQIDTNFGQGGRVVTSGANEAFFSVLMQGDQHILAAGTSNGDFLLARYDLAGNLDTSFGSGGRMITDLGAADDAVYGMAIAADGKIVVTGGSGGNFAFARFNPNGTPDLTFDQGGKTLFDLGTASDVPGAVAVQSDGKIVAVGSSGNNVAVVRLKADGTPDAAFSGDGLVMVAGLMARQDASFTDRSQALALQGDGKILIANHTPAGDNAVARLDGGGNLDGTFGTGGIATVDFAGDDDADAIILQNTGEIMVVGTSLQGGTARTTIAALSQSGKLIEGFGQGGKLVFDAIPGGAERELHVGDLVVRSFGTRQNDGRIVVGTSNQTPNATTSALKRLIVPGSTSAPAGSLLGNFGMVNGRNTRLTVDAGGGKFVTFSMKGGSGSVFQNGETLSLVLTDDGRGASVAVKVKGGDRRVKLGDVSVNGSLKSLSAKTGDLSGTLAAGIQIGKVLIGNVTGTIAAGGSIASLAAENLTNARVLAGTGLGGDRKLGGAGADADVYAGGSIGKISVKGQITSSLIGAGLNPTDGTYGDDDDTVVGAAASFIKSIASKGGADASTRFVAGSFSKVKLGKGKIDLTTDERFRVVV